MSWSSPGAGSGVGFVLPASAYGNPFPATWDMLVSTVSLSGGFQTDLDGNSIFVFGFYSSIDLATNVLGDPVRPSVGVVQAPFINGLSALQPQDGVGATPALAWAAPAVGTADYYSVIVVRMAGGQRTTLANIVTTDTSVRISSGLLEPGARYYFRLRAWSNPARDPFGLSMATYPNSIAERITDGVTP